MAATISTTHHSGEAFLGTRSQRAGNKDNNYTPGWARLSTRAAIPIIRAVGILALSVRCAELCAAHNAVHCAKLCIVQYIGLGNCLSYTHKKL